MINSILHLWCRIFHRSISHPVCGHYHCWQCRRTFRVDWTKPAEPGIEVSE